MFGQLNVTADSHMLDIGCGSGRIAHHAATFTGGRVSGFNIVESDIDNAIAHAKETGMDQRLDFKVGDHHKPFQYPNETFDASYSFEALWFANKPPHLPQNCPVLVETKCCIRTSHVCSIRSNRVPLSHIPRGYKLMPNT